MEFMSVQELQSTDSAVLRQKMTDEEKVVLTEDGKPMAIAVSVVGKDFEKFLSYIQRAEAIEAFYALGREAAIKGIDMSDEEIERAIGEIRRAERK